MNRVWERGLDPETAVDEDSTTEGTIYRPPQRGERGGAIASVTTVTGDRPVTVTSREGFVRGVPRNGREERNRTRNSATLGGGGSIVRGRGRREYDASAAGAAEPEAKRPRVTSAIVVPGAVREEDDKPDRSHFREDGELDRWNAGPRPADKGGEDTGVGSGVAEDRSREPESMAVDGEEIQREDPENGQQPQQSQNQRFGGKIVVVSSTSRGRRSERDSGYAPRAERGGSAAAGAVSAVGVAGAAAASPGRFRPGMARGGNNRPDIRPSLASRLGPVVGRPVVIVTGDGTDDAGENGKPEPAQEVPMVEPSKPELQEAYKDGDTKKRNRR